MDNDTSKKNIKLFIPGPDINYSDQNNNFPFIIEFYNVLCLKDPRDNFKIRVVLNFQEAFI